MPWTSDKNGGFSSASPWLPVAQEHKIAAVSTQENNAGSVLQAYRQFIAWRKKQPALCWGDIRFGDVDKYLLVFERHLDGESMLAVFNFSASEQRVVTLNEKKLEVLSGHGFSGHLVDNEIIVPAFDAFFARR